MPITTVHAFFQTYLAGFQGPAVEGYQIPAAEVVIGPPTVGQPHGPQLYIRARSWASKRISLTVPGTIDTTWQVRCTVRWAVPVGGTDASPITTFTALVDAMVRKLNRVSRQFQYQDPVTGDWSTLGLIGSSVAGELQGPWAIAAQRMQLWACPVTVTVRELSIG